MKAEPEECVAPPGLCGFLFIVPGLTPWARFCRASGALSGDGKDEERTPFAYLRRVCFEDVQEWTDVRLQQRLAYIPVLGLEIRLR